MSETHNALPQVSIGDVVFAAQRLENDGSHPDFEVNAVLVEAGTRGVVVKIGHPEGQPDYELFLVRFEGADGDLGPPVGCWAGELKTLSGVEA